MVACDWQGYSMEDFQAAFVEHHIDVQALDATSRRTAAMHLGGVAVECLLKVIICASLATNSHGEKEWKTEANDPGHTVYNPGHSYEAALRTYNKLKTRVDNFPQVRKWLSEVEHPECHFIDMRYLGKETREDEAQERYKHWKETYTRLVYWLQRQATQL
jgi:hypothetical protein